MRQGAWVRGTETAYMVRCERCRMQWRIARAEPFAQVRMRAIIRSHNRGLHPELDERG